MATDVEIKLKQLYLRLEGNQKCLSEDIRGGFVVGVEFYTQQIKQIRDEIEFLEMAGEEYDKDRL